MKFYINSIIILLLFLSGCSEAEVETSNSYAQYELAMNYLYGENGYTQNDRKAAQWFKKSADQGDSSAQNNLAIMYLNGRGVDISKENAKKYFLMAARQNHVNGQIQTALILIDERDEINAKKWLLLAIKSKDPKAYYYLGKLLISQGQDIKVKNEGLEFLIKAANANNTSAMIELYHYFLSINDRSNALLWLEKASSFNVLEAQEKLKEIQQHP